MQYPDLFNLPINDSSAALHGGDSVMTAVNQPTPCVAGPSHQEKSNNRGTGSNDAPSQQ